MMLRNFRLRDRLLRSYRPITKNLNCCYFDNQGVDQSILQSGKKGVFLCCWLCDWLLVSCWVKYEIV